jgi:hypothetical protein
VHIAFDVPNTPSGGNSRSGFAFMKTVRQLQRSIVSKAPPWWQHQEYRRLSVIKAGRAGHVLLPEQAR